MNKTNCFYIIFTQMLCLTCTMSARAQQPLRKSVSIVADQVELHKVIQQLNDQTGISFFYSVNAIGANRKVTCRYFNISVKKFLDEVLTPLQVQYKVLDNQIILFAMPLQGNGEIAASIKDSLNTDRAVQERTTSTIQISGTVLTEKGQPLEGASVLLEGTMNGTVTNKRGQFTLETDKEAGRIQISYTAYTASTAEFKGTTTLPAIQLVPHIAQMDEVVVVGYGTQMRNEVTSASSTVKGVSLSDAPVSTFDAALQGRAAGVLVSQQGGSPGSPVRIQVRGTSSISSGTEPLYIVDGIFVFQEISGIADGNTSSNMNPMINLNPDDIETIEILKDAAATAIYGARGANGVVMITTKQGKKGQGNLSLTLNRGFSNPNRLVDYVSGAQWLTMVDKARTNTIGFGISEGQERFNPLMLVANNLPTPANISGSQFGPLTTFTRDLAEQTNTNWRDKMLQQGNITDIKISAGNGFEKGNFYLSGQYWDEQGILLNQHLQKISMRSNFNFSPSQKWRFGARISPSVVNSRFAQIGQGGNGESLGRNNAGATAGWQQANQGALPIMPVFNDDGTYFDPFRGRNIVAGSDPANMQSVQRQFRFMGNMYAEFKPFKALTFRSEAGVDFINAINQFWVSDVIRYNRFGQETGSFISSISGNVYGTYQPAWEGSNHKLVVTSGAEWQKSARRRNVYGFEGLVGNQQEIGEISNGDQLLLAVSGIFPDHIFTSVFTRANYQYKGRFLFGGSFRRDGSSVFSEQYRFGSFPSLSAGWIISDEPGFKNVGVFRNISFLKLRSSYGQTGNAAIQAFAFQSNFVNWPIYGQAPALSLSVIGNPEIRWEKNNQVDAAIEFGLWKNRLRGSFGAFSRLSKDMLLNVPVSPTVGIGAGNQSVIVNIGNLRNSGLEFEASALIKDNFKLKNRLKWNVDFNVSFLQNKVTKLTDFLQGLPSGNFPTATGILQGVGITQYNGQLGTYYLAEYAGLDSDGFETIYEISREELLRTGRTVQTGNIIRATQSNINNNRMVQYGKSSLPTWYGGVTQTFQWKGVELRAHITFQGGNYIYDGHEELTSYVRTGTNVIRASVAGNSWTPDMPDASYPKLTWNLRDNFRDNNGQASPRSMGTRTTRYLYKGDYMRLKTVSIAYPFPANWLRIVGLQSAKVQLAAHNLFTFTKYPGFDPEIMNTGPGTQGRNLSQGLISSAPVPQVRTIMMGINIVL